MPWQYLAAAAAPFVFGAFQKKPKMPGAPAMAQMPDRSAYVNQLLALASNPNSQQFQLASDVATEQVNRALARQGLVGSSVGGQLAANIQAKLASDFINEQLQRQTSALNVASEYDRARAGIANDAARTLYQHQMANYERQLAGQAAVRQGIGAIANAGLTGWMANQEMAQREQDRAALAGLFASQSAGQVAPGGYNPSGYTGYVGNYSLPTLPPRY